MVIKVNRNLANLLCGNTVNFMDHSPFIFIAVTQSIINNTTTWAEREIDYVYTLH